MKATFLVTQQKEYLGRLDELLGRIESCNMLGEIDPAYYGEKKQEYISQYTKQMGQMAQAASAKGLRMVSA